MSIDFNYEITAVDEVAKCMEVVYTAEGYQTMHIGVRLPYEGENLEALIQSYAPVAYWLEQEAKIVVPDVGTSGNIVTIIQDKFDPLDQCKVFAKMHLDNTDWSQLADVKNILLNKIDFDNYRANVRKLYLNPIEKPIWPEVPKASWSTTL